MPQLDDRTDGGRLAPKVNALGRRLFFLTEAR